MRLFALKDENDPDASVLAVLSCYGASREYYLDMPEGADPWSVPLVLSSFASRGQWRIGRDWSRRWVESRLVPQSRQNLGEVLKANGLERYDSLKLLELTGGRNSQDGCYLEPIAAADAPAWFREREAGRIADAVALEGGRILVAFRTGETALVDVGEIAVGRQGLARVLSSPETFARMQVPLGGREVSWGTVASIADEDLRSYGRLLGLSWADLVKTASTLLVDTSEAAAMLACTRQNVHALARRGVLRAVKVSGKTTLYLRPEVRSRLE